MESTYVIHATKAGGGDLYPHDIEPAVPKGAKCWRAGGSYVCVETREAALAIRKNLERQHRGVEVRIYQQPRGEVLKDEDFALAEDDIFVPSEAWRARPR